MSKNDENFEPELDLEPSPDSELAENLTEDEIVPEEDEGVSEENIFKSRERHVQKSVSFPNESKIDETVPNETIFENLYRTKILAPWIDEKRKSSRTLQRELQRKTAKDITYSLNDGNAEEFGDVSHVGWGGRIKYALTEYNEEMARMRATKHEIQYDLDHFLNITIGTLICLADKKIVSKECFMFTEIYLKSIRNEYGDHPENIGNLLKYMRYLKKKNSSNYGWGEMSHFEPPKRLVIAKINEDDMNKTINMNLTKTKNLNKSRIPVPISNGNGSLLRNNLSSISYGSNKNFLSSKNLNSSATSDILANRKSSNSKNSKQNL